jgi:hypothetical protein
LLTIAEEAGLTGEELNYMSLSNVVNYIKGKAAANREQWRMVRRTCWVQAVSIGGYKGTEESLWQIDEQEQKKDIHITEKIDRWRNRLIELGKWKERS